MTDTQKKRRWFQALGAAAANIWLPSFFKARIYQGPTKGICVPVLNCYSCPSAVGACPIGALQNSLGSVKLNLSLARRQFGLYVIGSLAAVGSLVGRIPCGWLCPFGLIQEIVHKIPSRKFQIPKFLTYMKYIVLLVMVILLPLLILDEFGGGEPWFCKWICPAGTLEAGIPLAILSEAHPGPPRFSFRLEDGHPGGVPGLDGLCHAAVLSDDLPSGGDPGTLQQGQLVPDDGGRGNMHSLRSSANASAP